MRLSPPPSPQDVLTLPLLCSLVASLVGGFGYGFSTTIIASTVLQPGFVESFGAPTPVQLGAIVASFYVGAVIGVSVLYIVGDRCGRRCSMLCGALLSTLGTALMATASSLSALIVGRVIMGASVGAVATTSSLYITELAKPAGRGRLSACQQFMIATGSACALWAGLGFADAEGSLQWRIPFALQVIPLVLFLVAWMFLPESPHWLALQGRHDEARYVLRRLRMAPEGDPRALELLYLRLCEHIKCEDLASASTRRAPFATRSGRRRLALGSGVWTAVTLCGHPFLQYFQPTIYAALGWSVHRQLIVTGLYMSLGPLTVMNSMIGIFDSYSRVSILTGSTFSMGALFAVLASVLIACPAVHGQQAAINVPAQHAVVALVFAIGGFFTGGLGPMGWICAPEYLATPHRARGFALVQLLHYALELLITQITPVGLARFGPAFFFLFVATNVLAGVAFSLLFPDTRGKNLEDIDDLFSGQRFETTSPPPAPASPASLEKGDAPTHLTLGDLPLANLTFNGQTVPCNSLACSSSGTSTPGSPSSPLTPDSELKLDDIGLVEAVLVSSPAHVYLD